MNQVSHFFKAFHSRNSWRVVLFGALILATWGALTGCESKSVRSSSGGSVGAGDVSGMPPAPDAEPDDDTFMPQECGVLPANSQYFDGNVLRKSNAQSIHSYSNTSSKCDFYCVDGYDWDGTGCESTTNIVKVMSDGQLEYATNDYGNQIPDYSYVGFKDGEAIPEPTLDSYRVIDVFAQQRGDDTTVIQSAIDWVSKLPIDNDTGFRGVVKLNRGVYFISSKLMVQSSGVIIKGAGASKDGSILIDGSRDGTIQFKGREPKESFVTNVSPAFDEGSGGSSLTLESIDHLKVGDLISIHIKYSRQWVRDVNNSAWLASAPSPRYERTIIEVDSKHNRVILNGSNPVPLLFSKGHIEFAKIYKVDVDNRIENVGVEDIILISKYDRSKTGVFGNGSHNDADRQYSLGFMGPWYTDEDHSANAVEFNNVKNFWVRRAIGFFYKNSFIRPFWRFNKNGTIEDCAMLDQVSQDNLMNHAGGRGYSFAANGNRLLLQRNYTRSARHGFIVNGDKSSEVVFLDSVSEFGHLGQEAHMFYSQAVLFDNVHSDTPFRLNNSANHEHGQRAVSSTLWNVYTESSRSWEPSIQLDDLADGLGNNYAVGVVMNGVGQGLMSPGVEGANGYTFESYTESIGSIVAPRSLYISQLNARLGKDRALEVVEAYQFDRQQAVKFIDRLKTKFDSIPKYQDPMTPLEWLPDTTFFD